MESCKLRSALRGVKVALARAAVGDTPIARDQINLGSDA